MSSSKVILEKLNNNLIDFKEKERNSMGYYNQPSTSGYQSKSPQM